MIKKKKIFLFIFLISLNSCSFDNKTGIWTGEETEKKRISDLEKEQIYKEKNVIKVFSSENTFAEEKVLSKKMNLKRNHMHWNLKKSRNSIKNNF